MAAGREDRRPSSGQALTFLPYETKLRCCVCGCSGGLGQVDHEHLRKEEPSVGQLVVKIGGPAWAGSKL